MLQLIEPTQPELTLVSFALYKISEISTAMESALNRGVQVRIIPENPTSGGGKIPFGLRETLSPDLLNRIQIFVWPLENRTKDPTGRSGSLHIKAMIGDRHHLFLTNAHLMEYALSLNLELGILIYSPDLATQVIDLLDHLITSGTVVQS